MWTKQCESADDHDDDIARRKTAYEVGQALLYASAVDRLSNIAIGRVIPYMNQGPKSFHSLSRPLFLFNRIISRFLVNTM